MFSQVGERERSQGGLGIGLMLVRRLVELHGGTVEAHSEGLGRGSEFHVQLPLTISLQKVNLPKVSGLTDAAVQKRRILVVDDNEDAANGLALMLELMGHETNVANDGLEAVEMASKVRPDLILLDIGLPKLSGYEACRRIRELPWGCETTIVAITGWGQEEDRHRSKDAGFDHHFTKPVEMAALESLLV